MGGITETTSNAAFLHIPLKDLAEIKLMKGGKDSKWKPFWLPLFLLALFHLLLMWCY